MRRLIIINKLSCSRLQEHREQQQLIYPTTTVNYPVHDQTAGGLLQILTQLKQQQKRGNLIKQSSVKQVINLALFLSSGWRICSL